MGYSTPQPAAIVPFSRSLLQKVIKTAPLPAIPPVWGCFSRASWEMVLNGLLECLRLSELIFMVVSLYCTLKKTVSLNQAGFIARVAINLTVI